MAASRFVKLIFGSIPPNSIFISGLRASVIAIISAGVLPSMEKIGFVATDAIAAGLGWLGFVYVPVF
jgi:hypothetical protein